MVRITIKSCLAVCIKNDNYPASLELRKIYQTLPDPCAAEIGYIRVIDESGEDYLYPEDFFIPIRLPQAVVKKILQAAA